MEGAGMKFSVVADSFAAIEAVSSRLEMTALLRGLLEGAPKEDIRNLVYLAQGTIGPSYSQLDIGLGEKLVVEAMAKAYGYTKEEIEKKFKEKGDLGEVAEGLAGTKKQKSLFVEQLSVKKVFDNLTKIAKAEGAGSQELKMKLLAELLNSSSPVEAKFAVRFPLENLRLGIGDPTIMDALALAYLEEYKKRNPEAVKRAREGLKEKKPEKRVEELERKLRQELREAIEEKYNIHSDLGDIAFKLKESGLKGLDEIEMQPGIPFRPTAAERLPSAEEIIKKLGKCAVEAKYDGFRLQVHKAGSEVKIFSRHAEPMTEMFPEIVEGIRKQVGAKAAILEGEALSFNEETEEFYPFQVTIQRKRKYEIKKMSEEYPLRLFVFDLVFVNGKNLMPLPFEQRRKELEKIISPGPTIELSRSILTDDPKKLNEFFEQSVQNGLEGIIAKDLHAKYIAGARKFAWIKLKRSYKSELQDSIDVAIVGYYKGKGKRAQFGLGTILTAIYEPKSDSFRTIAKIGTGMSEEQLGALEKRLSKTQSERKPARVDSGLEPDFWVTPSIVVEARADEITVSPVHTCGKTKGREGYALRFPRMISVREDKRPEDATTEKEVLEMFAMQKRPTNEAAEGGA